MNGLREMKGFSLEGGIALKIMASVSMSYIGSNLNLLGLKSSKEMGCSSEETYRGCEGSSCPCSPFLQPFFPNWGYQLLGTGVAKLGEKQLGEAGSGEDTWWMREKKPLSLSLHPSKLCPPLTMLYIWMKWLDSQTQFSIRSLVWTLNS